MKTRTKKKIIMGGSSSNRNIFLHAMKNQDIKFNNNNYNLNVLPPQIKSEINKREQRLYKKKIQKELIEVKNNNITLEPIILKNNDNIDDSIVSKYLKSRIEKDDKIIFLNLKFREGNRNENEKYNFNLKKSDFLQFKKHIHGLNLNNNIKDFFNTILGIFKKKIKKK